MRTNQLLANLPNLDENGVVETSQFSPYSSDAAKFILSSISILYFAAILVCLGLILFNLIRIFLFRKNKEKSKKALKHMGYSFIALVAVNIGFFILNFVFSTIGMSYF